MAKSNGTDRDLKVVWRKTASLVPYARNARTHSDAQVKQIAASITEFGFTNPVLIDEKGGIIAGHGRVMAATALKRAQVPCIVLTGLTAAQRRAYVLADNQLALNAGWSPDMLRAELGALQSVGFDLSVIGFGDLELTELMNPGDGPDATGGLSQRFLAPPFSVLDARGGWWQDRKRAWLALGIKSEIGRGDNLLEFSDSVKMGGTIEQKRRAKKNKQNAFADQDKLNALRHKAA